MSHLNDATVLDAILSSPWERGSAEAGDASVPELLLAAEVSDAVDALAVDAAFDEMPGERTVRVATDLTWSLT